MLNSGHYQINTTISLFLNFPDVSKMCVLMTEHEIVKFYEYIFNNAP